MRKLVLLVGVSVVLLGSVTVLRGLQGMGPLGSRLGSSVTTVRPVGFALAPTGQDPRALAVVFPWAEASYCNGQFTVVAVESSASVEIRRVVSRQLHGTVSCLGLATRNGRAAAVVRLNAPVGDRRVVRSSDRHPLREVDWPASLLGPSVQ